MTKPRVKIADAYALIALLLGLVFIAATPPFGMGDETAHFERAYEVAAGAPLGADGLPLGMQRLIDDAFGQVKSGAPVERRDFARWAGIPLEAEAIVPYPEPLRAVLRLHSPLCYAHFAPVAAAGLAFNLAPLVTFYLGRLAALLAGVFLVRAAIGAAPDAFRAPLAFLGLMPTTVVYFSAFNIESALIGLGFLFFALVARHASAPDERISARAFALIAGTGFLLGQFKTGYLLVPAIALIIPPAVFGSRARWIGAMALIILPGALASLGWALIVKNSMLADLVYSTFDGNRVAPGEQLAGVFADPFGYLGVVATTLFDSEAPGAALKMFFAVGGWTNIPVAAPVYAMLIVALLLVWMSGETAPSAMRSLSGGSILLGVFLATAFGIMTLVYFQWNGVGADRIEGFQGRYLIAIAPLLLSLAPVRLSFLANPRSRTLVAFGAPLVGTAAMLGAVLATYYG
ncbi:MAG: DUF2142 domain-containing protein [Parvularculaceae bacterium]|nr:DUF2142 domain-containing protein [Parvularculaceae bacterium]